MATPGTAAALNILEGTAGIIVFTTQEETLLANKVLPKGILIAKSSTGKIYQCDGVTSISNLTTPINYTEPIVTLRLREGTEEVATEKEAQETAGVYTRIVDTQNDVVWEYDDDNDEWVNSGTIAQNIEDRTVVYDKSINILAYYKDDEFLVITTQTTAELIVQALGYTPADEATLIPLSEDEITQICTEFLVDDDDESSDDESVDDESV